MNLELTISPVGLKRGSLSIPEFHGVSIDKGLSIKASLGWPSGCASDAFCAVAKKLLGGAELSLQMAMTNPKLFTMRAAIKDLKLGAVVLRHAGLEIVSGTEQSIGLVGEIQLNKPPVTLSAAIRLTTGGIKLVGSMSGCWHKAFGSPYVSICNLFLAMALAPTPVGLEFGGRIEVGKKSCGKVFVAKGYIGINTINPIHNYIYADIGPITFQKFFDVFCLSVKLPRPLGDSGYPDGIKMSFSLLGKELPHAKISGFRFKGTISILGLRAFADIIVKLPTQISIKAHLSPLRIANAFKMYASQTDKSKGPYLLVDVNARKRHAHIEASGFVEVLGISREAKLLITHSKYVLTVSGKYLNLFNAGLRISANYGSITKASYVVEGWFKNDLFDKIARIVRDGLKKSADQANQHISTAQSKIKQQKAKFDRADAVLKRALRKVDKAKGGFDRAAAKMERARQKLNNICHIRRCRSSKSYSCNSHV